MGTIALIVICFGSGLIARALLTDTATVVTWLNRFIIYVSLPALILLNVPQLEISPSVLVPTGFAWLWLLIGGLSIAGIARWRGWGRETEGALVVLVVMGNTSFLGLPLIQAFFGDGVLGYAIFYDQLGSFLILSTIGLIIILGYSPYQNASSRPGVKSITLSVLKFPPMIALLCALLLPVEAVVSAISPLLGGVATLLMPCALAVVGMQFRPRLLPEHRYPVITGILLKMVISPLLATVYVLGLSSDPDVIAATIFQAAMPCMITPGLLAMNAGIAPRLIAALLGYGSLFAFASLPAFYFLVGLVG